MAQVTERKKPKEYCNKQLEASATSLLNRKHQMTPMTPFIESPTGRLTELVYLLSDRPLSLVHQAVREAEAERGDAGKPDPWVVVASALERLETMTEATLQARYKRREQARVTSTDRELVVS